MTLLSTLYGVAAGYSNVMGGYGVFGAGRDGVQDFLVLVVDGRCLFLMEMKKRLNFVLVQEAKEEGMLYPIGIQSFDTIRKQGYVYVDKTDHIWRLATTGLYFLNYPNQEVESGFLHSLMNRLMGQQVITELHTSNGRIDVVMETAALGKKIFKIGASFTTKNRRLESWKMAE